MLGLLVLLSLGDALLDDERHEVPHCDTVGDTQALGLRDTVTVTEPVRDAVNDGVCERVTLPHELELLLSEAVGQTLGVSVRDTDAVPQPQCDSDALRDAQPDADKEVLAVADADVVAVVHTEALKDGVAEPPEGETLKDTRNVRVGEPPVSDGEREALCVSVVEPVGVVVVDWL